MFSSLATRTSVQSFSISSIVRIMTTLCHSSGDSKCLPNLREGERARIRKGAHTSLCQGLENAKESREGPRACTTVLVLAGPSLSGFVWDGARMGKGPGQTQQGPWNAKLT